MCKEDVIINDLTTPRCADLVSIEVISFIFMVPYALLLPKLLKLDPSIRNLKRKSPLRCGGYGT